MSDKTMNNEEKITDTPVYDELSEPPLLTAPKDHPMWPKIVAGLREVYDPEIPVNMYELGLIYKVEITDREDGGVNVDIEMSLTSPGCPVAHEIPGMVQDALFPIEGIEVCGVELVWDPPWDPSMMAETAKMELNMFM